MKKFNWPIWLGFVISVFALVSYPFVFVNWASTRNFPWANLVLFAVAGGLVLIGVRRAFRPDRRKLSKILASVLTLFSVLILALFIFAAFIAARWLPASAGAPQVGQKAPDFTLTDTNNKPVALSDLLTKPIEPLRPAMVAQKPQAPKGVLLIFYRGYW